MKEKTVEWLVPRFREFSSDSMRLWQLTQLSRDGITAITEMPSLEETIGKMEEARGVKRDSKEQNQKMLEEQAELARREVADGFSIILTQHLVDIWGQLEAFVRTLVALYLEHDEGMKADSVLRLKVRIGEYEQYQGSEKYHYIVKLLEREEASALKNGVERFESLLNTVGLSGPVPKKLSRALFELAQLRNCIVHNARKADSTLIKACPWLDLKNDQRISPGHEKSWYLFKATQAYAILIVARTAISDGEDYEAMTANIFAQWGDRGE